MASFEDVNGDGRLDLVVHVSTDAFQLSQGDSVAVLASKTYGEVIIQGSDSTRVIP